MEKGKSKIKRTQRSPKKMDSKSPRKKKKKDRIKRLPWPLKKKLMVKKER